MADKISMITMGYNFNLSQVNTPFLSIREFNLLKLLATHQGCILKRDEIIEALWDQDRFIEYGNIDVHICHLRKKLEPDPHKPRHIVTKKGVGYLLAS